MKQLVLDITCCWNCPLFDRDRTTCKKVNRYVWSEILDEIAEFCPLPDKEIN